MYVSDAVNICLKFVQQIHISIIMSLWLEWTPKNFEFWKKWLNISTYFSGYQKYCRVNCCRKDSRPTYKLNKKQRIHSKNEKFPGFTLEHENNMRNMNAMKWSEKLTKTERLTCIHTKRQYCSWHKKRLNY